MPRPVAAPQPLTHAKPPDWKAGARGVRQLESADQIDLIYCDPRLRRGHIRTCERASGLPVVLGRDMRLELVG
jgi:hypothetical protein